MKVTVNGDKLRLESSIVSLAGLYPVLNGSVLPLAATVQSESSLTFSVGGGALMHVEVLADSDTRCWMKYWLEGLPDDYRLQSFGIRFYTVENLRAFLRNGYFSWDGSYYVAPEEYPVATTLQGYAMAQLLPLFGTGSVVAGFDRHDRYQQTFTLQRGEIGFSLTIETVWDEKKRQASERIESERLVIFEHSGVEDALRDWAQVVAQAMPPRLTAPPIKGWCSWYNLYAYITEENILDHLRGAQQMVREESLPMWVFQLDDGFTPEMGDWLDVKPQFPRGMKPLLDDIRAAGFTPGLWIAPFMVGNRSRLFREHPDWVVKDRETGQPLAHMQFYAEFRWHKRSEEYYILDTTHPDAFEYLREVFRIWRNDWGCQYFKTDFMHFGSEYGPDRAVWHQSGLTRIEIWRRAAEMIREAIGDAIWLGCGCPLWTSVGLVDAVRIGRDVGVEWRGDSLSAQSLLHDQATRNFANRILWQADPDCILLRERFHHLTDAERRSLALYAGMMGGLVMTSDDISYLSMEWLELWKQILFLPPGECHYPLLGQSPLALQPGENGRLSMRALDPVLVQVRVPDDKQRPFIVFILNAGETPVQRTYPLTSLGLPAGLYITGENPPQPINSLNINLQPHDGALLYLTAGFS